MSCALRNRGTAREALTFATPRREHDCETRATSKIYEETWAILELHFLTRPHLINQAQEELAQCFDSLMADGRNEPGALKDLACRTIQLRYGPAPAHYE
jgi:hypothetical protein